MTARRQPLTCHDDFRQARALETLLRRAKKMAVRDYALTGQPLGVTGEVAEYEAAQQLGLTLEMARTIGDDAFRQRGCRKLEFLG